MDSLFRNSVFNFFSQVIIFSSALALSIFLSRILGPARMGQYSYWMWLIGTGGVLLTLGLPRSLMRFTARYKSKNEAAVTSIISTALIYQFKLLILVSAAIVVLIIIFSPQAKFTYFIILVTLFMAVLNSLLGSVLSGLQKYNLAFRINLLISPLALILSLIVLFFSKNLNNLLIVNLIVVFITLVISAFYLRDYLKFNSKKISQKIYSEIKSYTLSLSVIVFLDLVLMEKSEVFFLKSFSSLEQLAFYSIGFGLTGRVMTLIPGAVSGVIMPKIAWLHGNRDPQNIKLTYYRSTRYLILITLPIIFAGIILIDLPVQIFYGSEYLPLIPVVSILLVSGGLSAIVASAAAVLYGTGNQNFILKLAGIAAAINILLDLLFIPRWGATGAALANAIAQIFGVITGTFYLVQVKKMPFPGKDGGKVLTASLGAAILTFILKIHFAAVQALMLLIGLSIFYLAVFSIILCLLNFFVKQDKDILNRLINKLTSIVNNWP